MRAYVPLSSRNDPRRWQDVTALTVALSLHAGLLALTLGGYTSGLFNDSAHRAGKGCDFFAVYQAGNNAVHGRSLYHLRRGGHLDVPYAYEYRYLPGMAQATGRALNLLPPWPAYAAWVGLCEVCLVGAVLFSVRTSIGMNRLSIVPFLWVMYAPYYLEVWVGQFTFVLACALYVSVLLYENGRDRAAAGLWALGVLLKPAAAGWMVIWASRRLWLAPLLLVILVLCDLSYFLRFKQDWPIFLGSNLAPEPTWHAGNVGLTALLYLLLGPSPLFYLGRVLSAIALGIPLIGATMRARVSAPRESFWLLAGCWALLQMLLFRDMWEHHLTLLLPFLVLSVQRLQGPGILITTVLLALPSPFVFYDVSGLRPGLDPQPFLGTLASLVQHSWRVVPLLALYAIWLSALRRPPALPPAGALSAPVSWIDRACLCN